MFKKVVICLALTLTTLGYAQSQLNSKTSNVSQVKITNFDVVVTVDSEEDIEKTFKLEDIENLLKETEQDEVISFSLICNGDMMSNGKRSTMTYSFEGNSSKPEEFLTIVSKLRKSAINYYKN